MAEVKIERDKRMFAMAWTAIVATAFGFILRSLVITDWGAQFNLSATELGNLNGVGLWPFAISIALASLVIDRIGFRAIFLVALVCHVISTLILFTAGGYQQLFWGTFILSFGNGCVEAAANPLTASVYKEDRVRWLNYLHSGWAGGLVLGGLLVVILDAAGVPKMTGFGENAWKIKIALILIPMVIYGLLMIGRKWPVTERVAANVSYRDMLKDAGAIGSFLVSLIAALAVVGIFPNVEPATKWIISVVVAAIVGVSFFVYTKSIGRPLYLLILLMMMPQAVTELGTASWVSALLGGQMAQMGLDAGWVLVATNIVLVLMRVYGSAVVHKISPVGMLAFSALVSAISMLMFAYVHGPMILVAALLFGLGTAFFWPTTLGFVSEQFPRSGSVGINFVGAAGMLAAGVLGTPLMGTAQDHGNQAYIMQNAPAVAEQVLGPSKFSLTGSYRPIDKDKVATADAATQKVVADAQANSTSLALRDIAYLPAGLFILYMILFFVFRGKGGYKREVLEVTDEDMAKAHTGA